MRTWTYITFLSVSLSTQFTYCQVNTNICFNLSNNRNVISLDSTISNFSVSTLKFYIDHVNINGNHPKNQEAHLIDFEDPTSRCLLLNFDSLPIDSSLEYYLKFQLGLDSVTNTSGILEGDLDPSRGMYWTWQSGYIHFKMEGTNIQCQSTDKEFQFHLGGYRKPYETLQTIKLAVIPTDTINVYFDLNKFTNNGAFQGEDCRVMSPGKEAQRIFNIASESFVIIGHSK